ncbi:MAG TPA: archaetidylserine decarboxylase [Pseudomonadales bacterium]
MINTLFVALQYLLPHHLLSRLIGLLARCEWPPLKNALIRLFAWKFRVNMAEAQEPELTAYRHFNAFFTRALKPDAREPDMDPSSILCPADGTVSQIGRIQDNLVLQAKGDYYSLERLLGGDPALARAFHNGSFATVYLSPRDYHRVHMPLSGTLLRTIYIPGRLFSVNEATAARVPNLFARNERLVCIFETPAGKMAVILVGAMIVAGIETVWNGPVTPPHRDMEITHFRVTPDQPPLVIPRAGEVGRFYLGSTAIVLFAADAVHWLDSLQAGDSVRMGQAIGHCTDDAEHTQ